LGDILRKIVLVAIKGKGPMSQTAAARRSVAAKE
jgi:hypothetical protein